MLERARSDARYASHSSFSCASCCCIVLIFCVSGDGGRTALIREIAYPPSESSPSSTPTYCGNGCAPVLKSAFSAVSGTPCGFMRDTSNGAEKPCMARVLRSMLSCDSLLRGLPAWRAKRRFFVGYVVSLIQMAVRRRVDDGSHAPRLKRCRLYPLLRCWMCRSILPGWKRRLQEISDDSTDPLHSMMPLAHA